MQVGLHNIVELNQLIKEQELKFRIHFSDACGGSSMWIESLEEEATHDVQQRLYELIDDYFQKQRMNIQYNKDKSSFWTTE